MTTQSVSLRLCVLGRTGERFISAPQLSTSNTPRHGVAGAHVLKRGAELFAQHVHVHPRNTICGLLLSCPQTRESQNVTMIVRDLDVRSD